MDIESVGFFLKDGIVNVEGKPPSGSGIPSAQSVPGLDSDPLKVPFSYFLDVPPSAFKFTRDISGDSDTPFLVAVQESSNGDKHPSMRNGKVF